MKKKFTMLLLTICISAQVFAENPLYLPTIVYRDYVNEWKSDAKYELTYDDNGRIVSAKEYLSESGEYQLWNTREFEYQRLPNGEFMKTKEVISIFEDNVTSSSIRKTSAYDNNGMQLFEQSESYNLYSHIWELYNGTRAVLNASSIRTGIEEYDPYDQQWKINALYTFEGKGRTARIEDEDYPGNFVTYEWGNELHELISATMQDNGGTMVLNNFEPLKNIEYFDIYSLSPIFGTDQWDSDSPIGKLVPYVWDDYTLHQNIANMDVSYMGMSGSYKWIINDAEGEWEQTLKIAGNVIEKRALKLLPNGSWKETYTSGSDMDISSKEYDEYGALTRDYYYNKEGYKTYEDNTIYEREYDAVGRPTKTTKTVDGNVEYIETYNSWTGSGINTPVSETLVVSPTVTTGIVKIGNTNNEAICVYTASGTLLFNVYLHEIDLSNYPNGMYFIKVGNRTAKVIKK